MVCLESREEMPAYERLLGDAMRGEATLFARQDGVEAAWRVVDPILDTGKGVHSYKPGTWGPEAADDLIGKVKSWHTDNDGTLHSSEC